VSDLALASLAVIEGNRFTLGEIDGSDTEHLAIISDAFKAKQFKAPVSGYSLRRYGRCVRT
jgi:hypothetical protein